ncbi:thiol reductant ABC exporter subunit CydC [Thiomonas bhubaneswarensis]|uniref:Thiol reductant ABC exporter, CydC subunit n=1 Tax=Thiomonas bhubaneswarensis TaxID=339866 RepID=A0A0K6HSU6_9BURK|nr:thiol reductant ABC exporter subunit CydC [Thiomonas bhubaneswarensis]CUA94000.1 thiol reductant ABC exporter, CydC subunit [Thiomonas bhubaneswarensis]
MRFNPLPPDFDLTQARADLRRLVALFRPYRSWMLWGAVAALLTLLANVALMATSGWFIAQMALVGLVGAAMDYFTPAAFIRGMAITRTAGRYIERLVTHEATFRLLQALRVWFYQSLEPLAPARLQELRSADLSSRILSDIDALNHLYLRVLVPVGVALIGGTLIVAMMAFFSLRVAASTLLFLLLAGVAVPLLTFRLGHEPGRRLVAQRAELRSVVVDGLQGLGELRLYGGTTQQAQRIGTLTDAMIAEQRRLSRATGLSQGLLGLAANLAMWSTLLLAIPLVHAADLTPAQLPMLALFVLASFEAAMPLPLALQMLGETLAAARRVFAILDARPQIEEPADLPVPRWEGAELVVDGLRLRYPGASADAAWALDGLSLSLRPGERVALVGPSGAGKSSLIAVLLRFWDYQAGSVRIGGHDLRAWPGEALRGHIAVVSQDTYLFNTTIRDNLMLAKPDATQEEVIAACKAAQLHDFITALPEGYETWVGEAGMRLSGGQARRVAIARALLRNAPLLILDEPTEGLDALTERDLLRDIATLMAGRTVLLITHRLAALPAAVDRVLVMESGRVVEEGAPAELLARPQGAFRALHDAL